MSATEHSGLLEALCAFQGEAPTLPKDGKNPHYGSKFTKLDTIVEKVGPLLAKNGLVWTTLPSRSQSDGKPVLRYRLAHAPSGEVLEDEMDLMLARAGAQDQGSAITYARRYAITAVLNLVSDEDDDGHRATQPSGESAQKATGGGASGKQIGLIKRLVKQHKVTTRELRAMLNAAGVDTPDDHDVEGWLAATNGRQASALIDELQQGAIPTGESDIDLPWGEGDERPAPEVPS